MTVATRREKSVSERQHYQQSSCRCQTDTKVFVTIIMALTHVTVAKNGSLLRKQWARDEKSTLWKRLGDMSPSRWVIPSATSLSKSIGSDSNVHTSAVAFEKGWDNITSSCKGSSAAFLPWSTSPELSEMSIAAYSDSGCAVVGDGIKCIQRWLTVHSVSVKKARRRHK